MAKALSAISPASIPVISRVPGRFTPSWAKESTMGRACWPIAPGRATVSRSQKGGRMIHAPIHRRRFLANAGALAAATTLPLTRVMAVAAAELATIPIPPPISSAERLQRLAKARALMAGHGIGAILVEAGPSLDYFTGVQWWRSERLTAAVIPTHGEPIIITPFFERPSVAESLSIPAEIRTWNEDEEPLKLVAGFLRERKVARAPAGFEETDRFFILDRLKKQLPGVRVVSGNPIVRSLRMIKTPPELALMQAANQIMLASLRYAGERTREGMTPAD